jgi:tetratricopeptide (TPR) repeat protein
MDRNRQLDASGGTGGLVVLRFSLVLLLTTGFVHGEQAGVPTRYVDQAIALARQQKWTEARDLLREGQRSAPLDPRFPRELAGIAYKLGDLNEAKGQLRFALSLDRNDVYTNDLLAHLFLLDGNVDAALEFWNRIDKPRIRRISIVSPAHMNAALLERSVRFDAGSTLQRDDLDLTRTNLERVAAAPGSYKVRLVPQEEETFDVRIDAVDTSPEGISKWSRFVSPLMGLPYQTLAMKFDSGSSARRLSSLFRWDPNKRRVNLTFSDLVLNNPRLRYTAGVDGRDENWAFQNYYNGLVTPTGALKLRKLEFVGQVDYGVTGRFTWINGTSISYRDYGNGTLNGQLFTPGYVLKQFSRASYDLVKDPVRGLSMELSGAVGVGRGFSNGGYVYSRTQAALTTRWVPQGRTEDITVGARAYTGRTFGQAPFDELFMLGMERDNDLWLRGHVGTLDGRKGNAPLGSNYVLWQSEIEKQFYRNEFVRLWIGPVLDIGKISDRPDGFGSRGWLVDTGVQSRIVLLGTKQLIITYGRDLRHGGNVFYTSLRL